MMTYTMVAIGGALGALARYGIYNLALRLEQHAALATLAINAVGAFLIGIIYVLITERSALEPHMQGLLTVGFLGAFTTYSTYSLDALKLLQQGQLWAAFAYLIGTLLLCLLAVWLGTVLMRSI